MIDKNEFKRYGNDIIEWIIEYFDNLDKYPVKSQVAPGEIYNQLPEKAPENSESIDEILNDFKKIILPGITHWQNPNFHAYFPANSSFPSLLGEMLTAAMGAQCMKWETSPSATELEEMTTNWLKNAIGIPENFSGVIQDSASSATLCSILTAREKATNYNINENGFTNEKFRVYCSTETHSSIEKAVKIAGIGRKNLVKIDVDSQFALQPDLLEQAIKKDIKANLKPLCIVAAIGTTGSTAIDNIEAISQIAQKYNIWLHIDAAYSGSALLLPEYRWMIKGIENADTFVFNAHKWLFTNFDCSMYYVKDKQALVNTFEILPEYLKTKSDNQVNNYCDWGIPLGRRFRALKLWFVLRNYGIKGLQEKLRQHINLAKTLEKEMTEDSRIEILSPVNFNLICFRYLPDGEKAEAEVNRFNEKLLSAINKSGKIFLSHTKLNGKYALRMVIGQTYVTESHVEKAYKEILTTAQQI